MENNVVHLARTKSLIDTTKDGEFSITIKGLPTEKDAHPGTIGAMRLVLVHDALENWLKEKFGEDATLSELVATAREQLGLKSRYEPSKINRLGKCGCVNTIHVRESECLNWVLA